MLRQLVAEALRAIGGDGGAGSPRQLDDLRLPVARLGEPLRGALALLDEVGAEERHVVGARGARRLPVDEDDRDVGLLGRLQRGGEALELARREQDDVHAARDQILDVGDLLRRLALRVGDDEVDALLLRLVADALRLGVAPGIVRFHLREADDEPVATLALAGAQADGAGGEQEAETTQRERERSALGGAGHEHGRREGRGTMPNEFGRVRRVQ